MQAKDPQTVVPAIPALPLARTPRTLDLFLMIVIIALFFGAALGAFKARKRGGNLADMLQYGAVYGMIFGILGLFGTIITHRMLV
ncbi:hypothetical protein [Tritonibacter mobilis]|uniref:hypothetical protein n=2 Tax=Pseudomonadota TaxID=1224 RepID=UPI000806D126|nr:hypothetical protein [Tritonibacter mobilis]GLP86741.1 hypothetical protein GCM10007921_23010 [Tritonibacter mobilis]